MKEGFENGYATQGVVDKEGEYSFIRTECKNTWYSIDKNPMRRNGCKCTKCGKTIKVIIPA